MQLRLSPSGSGQGRAEGSPRNPQAHLQVFPTSLHGFPSNPRIGLQDTTDGWNMGSKQKCLLVQCRFSERPSAAVVGFNVIPLDHQGGMFYLDRMVVEITQEVERLPRRMDANNLMSRRLAGCRNDLDAAAKIKVPYS